MLRLKMLSHDFQLRLPNENLAVTEQPHYGAASEAKPQRLTATGSRKRKIKQASLLTIALQVLVTILHLNKIKKLSGPPLLMAFEVGPMPFDCFESHNRSPPLKLKLHSTQGRTAKQSPHSCNSCYQMFRQRGARHVFPVLATSLRQRCTSEVAW